MSEAGRQSFTDKAGAALKPDSEKSTTEQAGDQIKGTADSVASTLQPNDSKSGTQKAGDAVTNNDKSDKSLAEKAQDFVGLGDKK